MTQKRINTNNKQTKYYLKKINKNRMENKIN